MTSLARTVFALIAAVALNQQASANTWAQLPFYSETLLFDLGDGVNELGDKAGKCLKPTSRSTLASGTTEFALRVEDGQSKRLDSATRTSQLSFDGGANFGVGGANAKYSRSKVTTDERISDDRKLYVVLEASATLSSESSYDYALSENGRAFLNKSPAAFIENCGAIVATELTRGVRIRAVVELTFSSVTAKTSVSEKLGFSAGGQYGAFSASASTVQQLDRILSTTDDKFSLAADVQIRGEGGVQGLSELSQQLSQVRTDPFTHVLEAVAALLKTRAADKGSLNKVRFVPVEHYVPTLDLLPWGVRERFWARSSKFYRGLLGLQELDSIVYLAREPIPSKSTRGHIAESIFDEICKRGIVDEYGNQMDNALTSNGTQCRPGTYVAGPYAELSHIKDRIRWLIVRCLSAGTSERVYCADESIVTFAHPIFERFYYSQTRLRSVPDKFSPSSDPNGDDTGETPVELWSEDTKIQVAERSFKHWLSEIAERPEDWMPGTFQEANAVWKCCSTISNQQIDRFSLDVDQYLDYLYDYKVGLSAYDFRAAAPSDIGLGYQKKDSSIWLLARGYFYPTAIEAVTPNGSSITFEFESKRLARDGEPLLFWYGDPADCRGGCESAYRRVLRMVQETRDRSVLIYLRAETLKGPVFKHIKTITAR